MAGTFSEERPLEEKREFYGDQNAILTVIEADLENYLARDKDAWEESWVHDDRMTSFMECGTLQIARGYETFRQNVFDAMESYPSPGGQTAERDNLAIHVLGNVAWAVFDQTVSNTSDPVAPPMFSHNFRLLEKIDGDWRIVFHGVWSLPERGSSDPTVEVDEDGRVLWMNPQAMETLPTFEGLTISNGKLRARHSGWDRELRLAIKRASKLKNYGRYNGASSEGRHNVRFPVLLGEGEDNQALLCFVRVANGRTYVSFGKSAILVEQIDLVSRVYGLSAAQVQVARLVAEGANLAEAADRMAISVNTVKTHLARMFEKTGVHSQIELLRFFLSFSD